MINKALKDHVIKSAEVSDARRCRVMCYMEPSCVSINVGPLEGGKLKCEFNNAIQLKTSLRYLWRINQLIPFSLWRQNLREIVAYQDIISRSLVASVRI